MLYQQSTGASSTPFPIPPPSPLPGAAFGREQPLVPCGPAPLLLFALCYSISASSSWAISRASSTATHWCNKLSWCVQAHQRLCSTLVSVSLREKDLKISLQAVKLSISSLDAIISTGLGEPKIVIIKIKRWTNEWMCHEWNTVKWHYTITLIYQSR